ncbi:MAG: multicomponent Na+:H+ antiporter subunit [Chloroflexota bacterium]|nr:multicomponent Na+:H+ antiporter subunit [Chloroflexota bacterium]
MSLLPFLAVTFGGAAAALIARNSPRLALAIGLLGLAGATIAALAIVPGDRLAIGPGRLEVTEFGRLFLALGCSTGTIVAIVGLSTAWQRELPAALLGGFGALGLALSIGDPIVALVAILAGSLVGSLVTLVRPSSPRNVQVATREFRAIAVAGALALVGMAWIARPLGPLAEEPTVFGLAYLAVALAAAIRFGAIPFHRWAARLADSAPEIALPLLLAWAPAGFAVVALAWMDRSIAPLLLPLEVERATVLAIGVASIVLGAAAAWLQDDVEHVVGYSIVQDAGFVILGLAILDPVAWQPTRTWILVFVVAKTAFAAWAIAVRTRFGTRRIADLSGWARRSPGLAVALVVVAVATLGLPGLVAWQVRARLVELSVVDGPLRIAATLGGLAALAYYGRMLLVGLRQPSDLIAAAPSERPRRPGDSVAAPVEPTLTAGVGEPGPSPVYPAIPAAVAGLESRAIAHWTQNRAPIASAAVLVLALTALAVAAGALGGPAAAAAPAPEPVAPSETFVPGQTEPPSPSPGEGSSPAPGESVGPGQTAGPSVSPVPGESSTPGASGGPSFVPIPTPSP